MSDKFPGSEAPKITNRDSFRIISKFLFGSEKVSDELESIPENQRQLLVAAQRAYELVSGVAGALESPHLSGSPLMEHGTGGLRDVFPTLKDIEACKEISAQIHTFSTEYGTDPIYRFSENYRKDSSASPERDTTIEIRNNYRSVEGAQSLQREIKRLGLITLSQDRSALEDKTSNRSRPKLLMKVMNIQSGEAFGAPVQTLATLEHALLSIVMDQATRKEVGVNNDGGKMFLVAFTEKLSEVMIGIKMNLLGELKEKSEITPSVPDRLRARREFRGRTLGRVPLPCLALRRSLRLFLRGL